MRVFVTTLPISEPLNRVRFRLFAYSIPIGCLAEKSLRSHGSPAQAPPQTIGSDSLGSSVRFGSPSCLSDPRTIQYTGWPGEVTVTSVSFRATGTIEGVHHETSPFRSVMMGTRPAVEYPPPTLLVARACARSLSAISNPARPVAGNQARLITGWRTSFPRPIFL